MRTIEEIKKEMTDNFLKEKAVRSKYKLADNVSFGQAFSKVSLESVLFYVVAFSIWVMEKFVEKEKVEIEHIVNTKMYGTLGWWREKVLAWQCGDATTVVNGTVGYKVVDESKRLAKHVAVQAKDRQINIKVAKEENGELKPLSDAERLMLETYVEEIKPAGLSAATFSVVADEITATLDVYYEGERSGSEVELKVKSAINNYLRDVEFDGTLYRNKLIDAVQSVDGVNDCMVLALSIKRQDLTVIEPERAYSPMSGYYKIKKMTLNMKPE